MLQLLRRYNNAFRCNRWVISGSQAKEAPLCCFPEEFQLPGLHSKELQGLLDDLSTKVAQPETPKPAPDDLSAITKALQQALAMPSADRGSLPPAPVQASITRTTNGAATYSSSGSARTDLFFKCEESGLHAHETIPQELLDQVSSKGCYTSITDFET